jgi:hypothetical protein
MRLISPLNVSLAWCVLGYFFLGRAESAGAIIASLASITTACFGRDVEAL